MGRIVRALIVSALVNFIVVFAAEAILGRFSPSPSPGQTSAAFMASIPTAVLWMLLAAWASAALLACLTAALLAPHVRWIAWAAAMLPLLGAMSNFVALPHPLWMEAVGITSPIVSAALVQRWQRKRG